MKNNQYMKQTVALFAISALTLESATAATTFTNAGVGTDIITSTNWSNGLPDAADDGTIAIDGTFTGSRTGWNNATVTHTAGTLTGNAFNLNTNATWNMEGGVLNLRYILANGSGSNFQMSGGTIMTLSLGTNQVGTANSGTFTVSGTGVIDATNDNLGVVGSGNNILSDWTGSWKQNSYSGTSWQTEFTDGNIKLDGNTLDAIGFASNFNVSADGKTLTLLTVPEPSSTALLGLGGLALLLRRRK